MPELPEVETITRRLTPYILNKSISHLSIYHPKSFIGDSDQVLGQTITDISRRSKMIRFKLSNGMNLVTHLKMTGQLIYVDDEHKVGGGHPTQDWVRNLPSTHTRLEYHFRDGSKLFFNDQRLFGWMKLMSDEEILKEWNNLGPDASSDSFEYDDFSQKLHRRAIPIKLAIMDNSIVSGVGNIYACDALNLAQISPFKTAKKLDEDEIRRLYKSIRQIIAKGIAMGGTTTDGKYVDVHGFAGGYQKEMRVYDRQGEACLHCGGEIVKSKLGGRGTYYCSVCQA